MKTMKYLCYMCCIGMLLALSACSSDDTLSKTNDANVMRFEAFIPIRVQPASQQRILKIKIRSACSWLMQSQRSKYRVIMPTIVN